MSQSTRPAEGAATQLVACLDCGYEGVFTACPRCERTGRVPLWTVHNSRGSVVGEVAGWDHRDAMDSVADAPEFDRLPAFTVRPKIAAGAA